MNLSPSLPSTGSTSVSSTADYAPKPSRILSFDGGGVRGLSSLLILRRFMEQLSHQRNSSSTLLPCDVFDLIIGTSTGGIIAIMLGRLRMSVDECIDVYTRLAKKVFGHPRSIYRLTGGLVALAGKSMYDKNVLESTLKDIIKQKTGHSSTFLEGGSGCRTIVVAALQEDGGHPVLLRSYSHNDVSESHCCIWEAARATSAASLFFPPIAIGDPPRLYIDGAVSGNCNPALLAVREAESLWPNRPVGCLLSIGTGSPSTIAVKGWIHELAKNFAALATECNRVHEMLEHTYKNRPHSPYFRFSVVGGLAKIRLDEWEEISPNGSGRLAALTDAYMSSHDQVIRLRNCLHQFDDNPVAPQPSPLLSDLTSIPDDEVVTLYKPPDKDPDLQETSNKASLYANCLFAELFGIPLFYPEETPSRIALADVGMIEWGRWKRIYNALDANNRLGLPTLPSAKVDGPFPSLRSIYMSDTFELGQSPCAGEWNFLRSDKAGAVLLCNPQDVYEIHLEADNIAIYLKHHFNSICEAKGIEDTRSGICFIVSMIKSADWAFEVQSNRVIPLDPSRAVITFKRHQPLELEDPRCWGAWNGTIGYAGPVIPASHSLSAVAIRRWKALRRPPVESMHAYWQTRPPDSHSKGDHGSDGKEGGPGRDGGGTSGRHRDPRAGLDFSPSSGGTGGGLSDSSEFKSANGSGEPSSTAPTDEVYVMKMQDEDPLDDLLLYVFAHYPSVQVVIAHDQHLVDLLKFASDRGCLDVKMALRDHAETVLTFTTDTDGFGFVHSRDDRELLAAFTPSKSGTLRLPPIASPPFAAPLLEYMDSVEGHTPDYTPNPSYGSLPLPTFSNILGGEPVFRPDYIRQLRQIRSELDLPIVEDLRPASTFDAATSNEFHKSLLDTRREFQQRDSNDSLSLDDPAQGRLSTPIPTRAQPDWLQRTARMSSNSLSLSHQSHSKSRTNTFGLWKSWARRIGSQTGPNTEERSGQREQKKRRQLLPVRRKTQSGDEDERSKGLKNFQTERQKISKDTDASNTSARHTRKLVKREKGYERRHARLPAIFRRDSADLSDAGWTTPIAAGQRDDDAW